MKNMNSTLYNNIEQLENGTPADKIITLKSVYKIKDGKFTIQPIKSRSTNWFLGIDRLSDMDKQKLNYFATPDSKIVLVDGITFDLNQEVDRINWRWVKHSPFIADSFEHAQMTPQARFYVYLEEREAETTVQTTNKLFKALRYVMEDSVVEYPNRAKLLGVDMSEDSTLMIQEFLLRIAKETPQRVIDAYESDNLSIKLLFLKAIDKEVILFDGRVYRYGNQVLGLDEQGVLTFMSRAINKEIVNMIDKDVQGDSYIDNETVSLESTQNDEFEAPVKVKKTTRKKTTK